MSTEEPSAESAPKPRFESYKDIASSLEAGDVIHTESIDGKITEVSYDPDAEAQAYVTVERPNKQGEVEEAYLSFDRILKFQDAITDIEKPQQESEVTTKPEGKFESNPELEKNKEEGKTDWNYVNELLAKKEEEKRSKMTPEELAEDDLKKKEIEEVRRWAETRNVGKKVTEKPATKDKKQPKQVIDIDEAKAKMDDENQEHTKEIRRQEYEKVKRESERFREEYGIMKSEEELLQEDEDLRKRFGID